MRYAARAVTNFGWALHLVLALSLLGCGQAQSADSRFATPERTVSSLFLAHGLERASQEQIRAQIIRDGGLVVRDRELYAACFADLDRPGGDALASYVVGMLAAARDDLRYELVEDHGYAYPREGARVVFQRQNGAYRIILAQSVPEDVQARLLEMSNP